MKILSKTLFSILVASTSTAHAWQIQTGDFNQWVASIKPIPSVYEQLDVYFRENQSDNRNQQVSYVQNLPELLKERSMREMIDALAAYDSATSCRTFFNAGFIGKLFTTSPSFVKDFEKEMLRVESASCLGAKNLDSVFNVLMSDEFQKKTIMGLEKITSDLQTNRVCQDISVMAIGRSNYCFTQNIWKDTENFVIHSYNESNAANASAYVYFREMVTVIKKLKTGEVVVYNLTYGRGPNIPFHSLAIRLIKGQHPTFINELIAGSIL